FERRYGAQWEIIVAHIIHLTRAQSEYACGGIRHYLYNHLIKMGLALVPILVILHKGQAIASRPLLKLEWTCADGLGINGSALYITIREHMGWQDGSILLTREREQKRPERLGQLDNDGLLIG